MNTFIRCVVMVGIVHLIWTLPRFLVHPMELLRALLLTRNSPQVTGAITESSSEEKQGYPGGSGMANPQLFRYLKLAATYSYHCAGVEYGGKETVNDYYTGGRPVTVWHSSWFPFVSTIRDSFLLRRLQLVSAVLAAGFAYWVFRSSHT